MLIGISLFFIKYNYNVNLLSLTNLNKPLRITGQLPITVRETFVSWLKEAIKVT